MTTPSRVHAMANRQNDQSVTQRFASLERCCLEPCSAKCCWGCAWAGRWSRERRWSGVLVELSVQVLLSYKKTLKLESRCALSACFSSYRFSSLYSGGCPACLCACFVPYRERLIHRSSSPGARRHWRDSYYRKDPIKHDHEQLKFANKSIESKLCLSLVIL